MEKSPPRYTLSSLAELLGGTADGPADKPLDQPIPAGDCDPLGVTFAENDKYLALAEAVDVGAIIVGKEMRASEKALIRVESPRMAFGMLLSMSERPMSISVGIHTTAVVDPSASVHPAASIGAYVVIQPGVKIERGAKIFPFVFVGDDCEICKNAVLYPHAVLYRDVFVGANSVIHSGAIVGADGFGYVWTGQSRMKVPQVGSVIIEADAEIGANSTIDRATAGATTIGEGVKLDNLVQIAHNVSIGDHSVIAAQSGISGSTKVGKRVVMGGNVGTTDHVNITDDVVLGGRSSVGWDLTEPGAYFGTPAIPGAEAKRSMLLIPKLPELLSRIRALEKKVRELEKD
ncbi:MAG TPA: UDP-3-O-(3-hydroxymyristoyl)glucosamine N-acyltransferase [Fimbriimonadaceae bacterium]|jgi:UDP-3-O-[3-hydroxymyristoyl] glucosamine N-acyltransferase